MIKNLHTIKSQKKYSTIKGRFVTCKICGYEFKHKNKQKRDKWLLEKSICPNCKETYANKPETEKILMDLQDLYFEKKDKKILNEIAKILIRYVESLLKKRFSNYIQESGSLKYYGDKAVSFLIEEFCCDENYRIWGSWAGLLDKKIRQAIFEKNEKSIENIIREKISDDIKIINLGYHFEDNRELMIEDESQRKMFDSIDKIQNKQLLHDCFINIIKSFQDRFTNYQIYSMLYTIRLRYNTNEETIDNYYKWWSKEGLHPYLKIEELFKREILKNLN